VAHIDGRHRHGPGPVVRPYALVRGRTRESGAALDVIAMVRSRAAGQLDPADLEPEHLALLARCRQPMSAADLSAAFDLPLGVVRILVADLRERGLVDVDQLRPERVRNVRLLREVADGLRRL
jgi:DNA-binding transcriptional ArsR family regulator